MSKPKIEYYKYISGFFIGLLMEHLIKVKFEIFPLIIMILIIILIIVDEYNNK